MIDPISGVGADRVSGKSSSPSSLSSPQSGPSASGGLASTSDTIDLSTNAQLLAASTATKAAGGTLVAADFAQSSIQMVTFSVIYPGGGGMTTTMSAADFQAALVPNDPNALGGEYGGAGGNYNVKDILLEGLGLKSAPVASPLASSTPSDLDHKSSDSLPPGDTDAMVASALLETMGSASDGSNSSARTNGLPSSALATNTAAEINVAQIAGTQEGVSFSLAFTSVSVASMSNSIDIET